MNENPSTGAKPMNADGTARQRDGRTGVLKMVGAFHEYACPDIVLRVVAWGRNFWPLQYERTGSWAHQVSFSVAQWNVAAQRTLQFRT